MKVFDSIIFFNELELLEMRLNILNDVVDYFVVTESPFTVSGNEKPLYYAENKDRFGKFNDKIIHHVTEEIPNDYNHLLEKTKFHCAYKENDPYGTPMIDLPVRYQRALFNRNNSAFGIEKGNPKPEDIIITSDADEILDPRVLENLDWFDGYNHYVGFFLSPPEYPLFTSFTPLISSKIASTHQKHPAPKYAFEFSSDLALFIACVKVRININNNFISSIFYFKRIIINPKFKVFVMVYIFFF